MKLDELLKIWQKKWSLTPSEEKGEKHSWLQEYRFAHMNDAIRIEGRPVRGKNVLIASIGSVAGLIDAPKTSDTVYFYHTDHLGTPILMTDSKGKKVWEGAFMPFGEPLSTTGTVDNNLRFPGQYYDGETGTYYNYFRDYNPVTGRYQQADPIGFAGGINVYTYVENNTLGWVDLLGLEPSSCTKKCVGTARVLQGNSNHIGKMGGFSTKSKGVVISSTSAAIDPFQWGGKVNMRQHIDQISGSSNGAQLFDNVADVMGGNSPCPNMNVRDCMRSKNPDKLLIELPGGEGDLGSIPIEITIPAAMSCPKGTMEKQ